MFVFCILSFKKKHNNTVFNITLNSLKLRGTKGSPFSKP